MTYVSYISFLVRMGTPFFPRMGFLSMPKIWLAFLTRASTASGYGLVTKSGTNEIPASNLR